MSTVLTSDELRMKDIASEEVGCLALGFVLPLVLAVAWFGAHHEMRLDVAEHRLCIIEHHTQHNREACTR